MSGKRPENYQIEDFVTDETFINYHFNRNSADQAFWEDWLAAHPENIKMVEEAKEMLQNLSLTLSEKEYTEELAKIEKAINNPLSRSVRSKPVISRFLNWGKTTGATPRKRQYARNYALFLVPAILICLIGGNFLLKFLTRQPERLTERFNDNERPVVFTLNEGTVVTLAPHGVFRYPSSFGNKDRRVYLDGEAQFQVTRDDTHPFKVYAGDLVGTVLGTIFHVKKLPGDSVVLIELIKGKLKVETIGSIGFPKQTVLLIPDERVVYRGHGQKMYKERWQPQGDSILTINHLVFRQNNFEEIARKLKEVFGVNVINKSKKKAWRFTGEFRNTTALNILKSICIVEGLKYEVQEDTVFIK
jgi:transmembrane sensor